MTLETLLYLTMMSDIVARSKPKPDDLILPDYFGLQHYRDTPYIRKAGCGYYNSFEELGEEFPEIPYLSAVIPWHYNRHNFATIKC